MARTRRIAPPRLRGLPDSRLVRGFVLLIAVMLIGCAAPARAADWHDWHGDGTGVFRTAAYDRGEWIYTNGIWQAKGANTDGLHRRDYFASVAVPGDPTNDSRDLSLALTYGFFGAYRASHNGDFELPRDPVAWPDGSGELAGVR